MVYKGEGGGLLELLWFRAAGVVSSSMECGMGLTELQGMYVHVPPSLTVAPIFRSSWTEQSNFTRWDFFFSRDGISEEKTLMCRFRGMITCDSSLEKRVSDGPIRATDNCICLVSATGLFFLVVHWLYHIISSLHVV